MTSRLAKWLTLEEQNRVINAFQRRFMLTDALLEANAILEPRGKSCERDGMEIFLQEQSQTLWQIFKAKTSAQPNASQTLADKRFEEFKRQFKEAGLLEDGHVDECRKFLEEDDETNPKIRRRRKGILGYTSRSED